MRLHVLAIPVMLSCLCQCAGEGKAQVAPATQPAMSPDVRAAYAELLAAKDWRNAATARDKLKALGDAALPALLDGTTHADKQVREYAYEALRDNFPTDPRAVDAFIRGLDDADEGWVRYPCAFHLGAHHIDIGREPLRKLAAQKNLGERTRYAAYKSLAELGDRDVMVSIYKGLGSDDYYVRYLSNLGVKALTGRDLTAFDYPDVSEGSFVSGPAVAVIRGQPIEKAETRARRWRAVADFAKWLKVEKPELFAELEKMW